MTAQEEVKAFIDAWESIRSNDDTIHVIEKSHGRFELTTGLLRELLK